MHGAMDFVIDNRRFGRFDPYVIAEIGVNHEGDIDRAKAMIDSVARAGGHAAKFQTYSAEKLAAATTSPAYWDRSKEPTASQFDLFKRWDSFGPAEYGELWRHCRDRGVDFISTPFDLEAVDMLDPMMPAIKIASADLTNVPLLRRVGSKRKPVILSVGAARYDEVAGAIDELLRAGAGSVSLLHCVLNYPTPVKQAHLRQIDRLFEIFGDRCGIGYSDHVTPEPDGAMPALEVAVLRGAVILEKHFTDDKNGKGNDHYHAMDEAELAAFIRKIALYRDLVGEGALDLSSQQAAIDNARRRVVAAAGIARGTAIAEDDLIALRSNVGIEVAHWDRVLGRKATRDIEAGHPLVWGDFE